MEKKKTHWKSLTNPTYIGAFVLEEDKDLTVTIESVAQEEIEGEKGRVDTCIVAQLKDQLPFIINKTNCKTISKALGSPHIEDWAGQKITLFEDIANLKGEMVPCIRVRSEAPKAKAKPELTPKNEEKWEAAKKAYSEGSATVEQIKTKYTLSAANEKLLTK